MQRAEKRFQAIVRKSKQSGITPKMLSQLEIVQTLCKDTQRKNFLNSKALILAITTFIIYGYIKNTNRECIFGMPLDAPKVFREAETCNICKGVTKVDKVMNISPTDFEENYALPSRPVVITDGTRGWSAVNTFDFKFFKNLYANNRNVKAECQFFPYNTEFETLREALNMSEERSRLESGTKPWYIGWSNCNDDAGMELRKYYSRPYFLPETSENIALSWIFMGGPGDGAYMHVDNVLYPSWQAQLQGRKKWRFAPPPECLYSCQEFEIIVEPGEIIVVDTNRWYHQTYILPNNISITIGSEFD